MIRTITASILAIGVSFGTAFAQDAPFGTDTDAAYAAQIWSVMNEQKLAGDGMIRSFPYDGVAPHGMMLETFYTTATIGDHTGDLIVKRNYGPEGVTADEVLADPGKHLGAITVMYRREAGFDDDNQNWFWVKYLPDGSLDKNPKGMRLVGKIAKGADQGCIACHSGEDDYIFTSDHLMN